MYAPAPKSAPVSLLRPAVFGAPVIPRLGGQKARRILARRRWVRRLERFPLLAATYFSKFSVPPFGAMGLALATPLLLVVALVGFLAGLMELQLARAGAFVLMLATLLSLQVIAADNFSIGSLALLVVVHLPYVFQQRRRQRPGDDVLQYFQRTALVIAGLGIAQYLLQFPLGARFVFPIENLLPLDLTLGKYNSEAILYYGSDVRRANGIFMMEPSIFSQLTALGIVIEMATRKRLIWMALMTAGMLVSYSGTGVMLLGICLVYEGVSRQRWGLLMGAGAMIVLLGAIGLWPDLPMITRVIDRSSEFGQAGTSGSMRFVGGFALFEKLLWPDPFRAFFGYGAGSLATYATQSPMPVAEMLLFKVVFEYGLLGAAAYLGFLGICIFGSSAPKSVRLGVCVAVLIGGMYTPFGHVLACGLLLWPRPSVAARPAWEASNG